jgi:hypothetical protein
MHSSRASAAASARLVLVQRRDTPAARDPYAAPVRRYRLARTDLAARPAGCDARVRAGRTG